MGHTWVTWVSLTVRISSSSGSVSPRTRISRLASDWPAEKVTAPERSVRSKPSSWSSNASQLTVSDPMVPPRRTTYQGQTFHATGMKGVMVERWGSGGVGKMRGGGGWEGGDFWRFYFWCFPSQSVWSNGATQTHHLARSNITCNWDGGHGGRGGGGERWVLGGWVRWVGVEHGGGGVISEGLTSGASFSPCLIQWCHPDAPPTKVRHFTQLEWRVWWWRGGVWVGWVRWVGNKSFVTTNTRLSHQTCVCHDKTHLLLWQKYACHKKTFLVTKVRLSQILFVVKNIILSQQKFCCNKHTSVATNTRLSQQNTILVAAPVSDSAEVGYVHCCH